MQKIYFKKGVSFMRHIKDITENEIRLKVIWDKSNNGFITFMVYKKDHEGDFRYWKSHEFKGGEKHSTERRNNVPVKFYGKEAMEIMGADNGFDIALRRAKNTFRNYIKTKPFPIK